MINNTNARLIESFSLSAYHWCTLSRPAAPDGYRYGMYGASHIPPSISSLGLEHGCRRHREDIFSNIQGCKIVSSPTKMFQKRICG